MATFHEVIKAASRALKEATTIAEARQGIARELPDADSWMVDEAITGLLGGDVRDPSVLPTPGSLREKFWSELANGSGPAHS